ncbi:MAG: simple sugar transport system ATP-binding protein [Fusobacteria bacterium]|nr:MAG: simple sugar transport system ATP-binding protein [Fusobacteriota bacterium]KAF0228643.1 MAG: simple sugar transport system ATP-binding [Fusobacteriota bacterium]
MSHNYSLSMKNITKKFGDFTANENVNLDVEKGEIHGILGENGAGKSTLMNVLYGLYKQTEGDVYINEEKVQIDGPLDAIAKGIGMIHQHFMLISAFSVSENIALGLKSQKEPFIDMVEIKRRIKEVAEENNLTVDPDAMISDLSVGQQQQVEILKALYRGGEILILDEPTGVLTPQESEKLFATLKMIAKKGHSIIFISHKLDEVLEICDKVTILRRGKNVGVVSTENISKKELAGLMVGREVTLSIEKEDIKPGKLVLDVSNLTVKGSTVASSLKSISFSAREGEIIGIAGVDGNGQRELVEAIAGLNKVISGTIKVNGEDITNKSAKEILKRKIALIPESRKVVGSVCQFNLVDNMILRQLYDKKFNCWGVIKYKEANIYTDEIIEEYDIRTAGKSICAAQLSGGNLQKLILGREIHLDPNLLLAMHPTRGLDVGAIEFVHEKLLEQRKAGKTIVYVSTELEEVMGLSDRIIVLYNGKITGIVDQLEASRELLGRMMAGEYIDDIKEASL